MKKSILTESPVALEREVTRLNKKATKIGVAPILLVRLGNETVTRTVVYSGDGVESERSFPVDVVRFEITLPDAEHRQWELCAKIEPNESGKHFVDSFKPGFDRAAWEHSDFNCEHCRTVRHRNLMYVVRNRTTDQMIQLGRNCFQDYVGKDTLSQMEFRALLSVLFGGEEQDFIYGGSRSSAQDVVETKRIIRVAEAMAVVEGGWRNNQKDEYGEIVQDGTHRRAATYVDCLDSFPALRKQVEALVQDGGEIAQRVDAALEAIKELEISDNDENDFARTLQYCASFHFLPRRRASIAAYLCQFFRNEEARKAREARKATMKHVGTIGKRETFQVTCVKCIRRDGAYGVSYVNVFQDPKGNELVWFTTIPFNIGESATLKATVKEHSFYNDTPRTIISRAKTV